MKLLLAVSLLAFLGACGHGIDGGEDLLGFEGSGSGGSGSPLAGSGSGGSGAPLAQVGRLTGSVATGEAVEGTLEVYDLSGSKLTSVDIDDTGSYSFLAPDESASYLLKAVGSKIGDKTGIVLYGMSFDSDVGGIVNINPWTDAVTRSLSDVPQSPENDMSRAVTLAQFEEKMGALAEKVDPSLFDGGSGEMVDVNNLRDTGFVTGNKTGIDRVLEVLKIRVDDSSQLRMALNCEWLSSAAECNESDMVEPLEMAFELEGGKLMLSEEQKLSIFEPLMVYVHNVDSWSSGSTFNMSLVNTSNQDLNGWTLGFDAADRKFNSFWNVDSSVAEGSEHAFKSFSWSAKLSMGGTVETGFVSDTMFSHNFANCVLISSTNGERIPCAFVYSDPPDNK